MSVRMRHTKAHTGNRRSHHALKQARLSTCQKCGESHIRHRACANCGTYREKQAIDVMAKIEKKEKKQKERAKERQASGN